MDAPVKTTLDLRGRTLLRREQWAPSDLRTSRGREKALMLRMEVFIKELGNSRFYRHFRHLLRTSSISEHIRKVLGARSKMQMVIYGIGTFKSCKRAALQLSLAILMQRDFEWMGNIEVFEPELSTIECRILEAIGCSVLSFNEHGMRKALEPTLFFMPYCPLTLHDRLLLTNWNPDLLSNVVVFGNSFHRGQGISSFLPSMAVERFANEFIVETRTRRISFIDKLSWTFFNLDLQFMNNFRHYRFNTVRREIDLQVYSWTELILKGKIEKYINYLENSQLYYNLQDQLQTPPISQHLDMLTMGSETKIKMVICDIGSLECSEKSRWQFSLAILMKKHFRWIGDIQVFEPFLSATECRILKAFGCTVLSFDEFKRSWQAIKPTIFFVANAFTTLYNHLLEANWKSSLFSNFVLFGNSLEEYEVNRYSHMDLEYTMRYNEAINKMFIKDIRIKDYLDDFRRTLRDSSDWEDGKEVYLGLYNAFCCLTWQFFDLVTEAELQFMNQFLQKGSSISMLA